MGLLTKADLEANKKFSYTWTHSPGDNPNITGKADSGRVSRAEGYEVLDFINAFATKHGLTQKTDGFKIERMLHASKAIMRKDLTAAIEENWNKS